MCRQILSERSEDEIKHLGLLADTGIVVVFSPLAWGAEVDQGQRLYLQYCSLLPR
jgi:hypothetical protein